MVAPVSNPDEAPAAPAAPDAPASAADLPRRDYFQELRRSLTRAAELQIKLLKLKARLLVKKVALSGFLMAGAAASGMVGVVFTYIFVFKLLTDVLLIRPVWAWAIFAGFHGVFAAAMVLTVVNIWREPAEHAAKAKATEGGQ